MTKSARKIDAREQVLSTSLLGEGSATRLLSKFKNQKLAQLELEHIQVILWVHYLEEILDCIGTDAFDPYEIIGRGQVAILDEAMAILDGTAVWDREPSGD